MSSHKYPCSGWLPENTKVQLEWDDQGRDMSIRPDVVQAPGNGQCIAVPSDRPFPNGFGPSYPIVRIDSGPFSLTGHPQAPNTGQYYLGHTTSAVKPGQHFKFGDVLAHANQGINWAGTLGGWVELGQAFDGVPGPKTGRKWFDPLLEKDLVVKVPDPPLRYGAKGWAVIGLTHNLQLCGWLKRAKASFDREVHGAVVAFKVFHHIPMPPVAPDPKNQQDRGVVDLHTAVEIKHAAAACKKNHKKEFNG